MTLKTSDKYYVACIFSLMGRKASPLPLYKITDMMRGTRGSSPSVLGPITVGFGVGQWLFLGTHSGGTSGGAPAADGLVGWPYPIDVLTAQLIIQGQHVHPGKCPSPGSAVKLNYF